MQRLIKDTMNPRTVAAALLIMAMVWGPVMFYLALKILGLL